MFLRFRLSWRGVIARSKLIAVSSAAFGCAIIYPELNTPLRSPGPERSVAAPENPNVVWVAIKEGEVPERTRDGRSWHEAGSKAPDPYVIVYVNGLELLRTDAQPGAFHPTWPGSPHGNFRFAPSDRLRVELWESGFIDRPICVRELGTPSEVWLSDREIDVRCDSGGRVVIRWEPAHGFLGYGLFYELRTSEVYVTRVYDESPAARAGIRPGDQLLTLGGRRARDMKSGQVKSYLNASRPEGLHFQLKHENGASATVTLNEGPVYPLFYEYDAIP